MQENYVGCHMSTTHRWQMFTDRYLDDQTLVFEIIFSNVSPTNYGFNY